MWTNIHISTSESSRFVVADDANGAGVVSVVRQDDAPTAPAAIPAARAPNLSCP